MSNVDYDVIVCTYHGADYISAQIESIMTQSVLPSNVIISDDSLDRSILNLIDSIASQYSYLETEWVIIKGPQKGVVHNFLSALRFSTSELLFFSDQDDIWYPSKVSTFLDKYANYDTTKPVLLYSDAEIIDEKGFHLFDSFIREQKLNIQVVGDDSILLENCVQGASCCINSSLKNLACDAMVAVGVDKIVMHDWYLAILAKYAGNVYFIDLPLIGYRQHSSNQVGYVSLTRKYIDIIKSPLNFIKKLSRVLKQKSAILNYLTSRGLLKPRNIKLSFSQIKLNKRIIYSVIEMLR